MLFSAEKKTYITKEQWSAEINKVHFFINNKWLNQNTETEKLKCHHVHPSSWGSLFFEYNSLLHFLWMRARTLVFGNCFIIYPYLPLFDFFILLQNYCNTIWSYDISLTSLSVFSDGKEEMFFHRHPTHLMLSSSLTWIEMHYKTFM